MGAASERYPLTPLTHLAGAQCRARAHKHEGQRRWRKANPRRSVGTSTAAPARESASLKGCVPIKKLSTHIRRHCSPCPRSARLFQRGGAQRGLHPQDDKRGSSLSRLYQHKPLFHICISTGSRLVVKTHAARRARPRCETRRELLRQRGDASCARAVPVEQQHMDGAESEHNIGLSTGMGSKV